MARETFYVIEKIGPKQSLTPEGFLFCEEVPVARTGMMLYGPNETPVEAGPDGIVKIFRDEEAVFDPLTMASVNGKSVTNDHPETDVDPENWKELTHGVAFNPRRGKAASDDLLFVDLLITTTEGIKAVQSGKVEVSCGYEADYQDLGNGVGKQSNIIFNHIALVEQGRCGPRCAIADSKTLSLTKGIEMAGNKKVKQSSILDALMKAFKAKDADEVEALAEEVKDEFETSETGGGDTHIHVHADGSTSNGNPVADDEDPEITNDDDLEAFKAQNATEHADMLKRIEALEAALAGAGNGADEEMNEEIKNELSLDEEQLEEVIKTKDSKFFSNSFQDTVAMAEILVPGIKVPTFDSKLTAGKTFKAICALRTQALDLAYVQPATRSILDELLGGKPLNTATMTCDAVRSLFRSAAAVKSVSNKNSSQSKDTNNSGTQTPKVTTLASLNEMNRQRYQAKH